MKTWMTTLIALLAPAAVFAAPASPTALVGSGVGSPDLFISQGNKAYNEGQYSVAKDDFLKAARANPAGVPVYLSLARAYLQTKEVAMACYSYKVYLKNAGQAPDREKAQSELEQCEKQKASLKPAPIDPSPEFVTQKAAFQEAAEASNLTGTGSAADVLRKMLRDGYAAPDLSDMATKLRLAAEKKAADDYARAVHGEVIDPTALRANADLFQLALDVGSTDPSIAPRENMLQGLAWLQERKFTEAEKSFAQAAGAGNDKDAKFFGAVAVYRSGDRKRALQMMETDLPDDPRPGIFRADSHIGTDSKEGTQELEKVLFQQRFKNP
jgi:tetratricopeptide (TPR) repeat protein